jgi:RNA polymerase sigma factor (sigma-70 family)
MSLPQRTDTASVREVAVVDHDLPTSTPAERAWAAVYERLFPRACRSAARLIGKEAAYDAVQDGMLEVLKKWPTLAPEERTDAFVLRSIRFRVIDEFRRQSKLVEYTAELEDSGAVPVLPAPETPSHLAVIVDQLISAMPPQRRAMCVLVYEDGLTIPQAATELGIAVETARRHMKLAHIWLREHMPPVQQGFRLGPGTRQLPPPTQSGSEDAPNE